MPDPTSRYFRRTGIPAPRTELERAADKAKKVANPKTFITPPRTIKENLVNRGPGQRAAASYLSAEKPAVKVGKTVGSLASRYEAEGTPKRMGRGPGATTHFRNTVSNLRMGTTGTHLGNVARNLSTPGTLKAMAKTAGRVGARVAGYAAGPIGVGLLAMDVYDTAKTTQRTVGAYKELGKELDKGKQAKAAGQRDLSNFKAAYPAAGAALEKKQKTRERYTDIKEAAGGKAATLKDVVVGKGGIYPKGRGKF